MKSIVKVPRGPSKPEEVELPQPGLEPEKEASEAGTDFSLCASQQSEFVQCEEQTLIAHEIVATASEASLKEEQEVTPSPPVP